MIQTVMLDLSGLMVIIATLAAGGVLYIIGYEAREIELQILLRLHGSRVRVLLIGRSLTTRIIHEMRLLNG